MLIDLERHHLQRLLSRYSFEHLKPPQQVYAITIPEEDIFLQNVTEDRRRRKIFYKVPFEREETAKIVEVRRLMQETGVVEEINDELILKHIYAGKWNSERAVARIREMIAFNSNPLVTHLDEKTISKLQAGSIYAYGWDRQFLPLLVMRIDKIDFKAPLEEIFNPVYYLMLVVKAFKMVPYHAEKFVLLIDFNNISLTNIPYFQVYDILRKMGTYFCGLTERTLLYNSVGISKIWKIVYSFLPEYQKKKIIFIPRGEERKALEWIDEMQLERRYGGRLPNLTSFWPPKGSIPEDLSTFSETEEYFSVQNNLQFFDPVMHTNSFCEKNCTCNIY